MIENQRAYFLIDKTVYFQNEIGAPYPENHGLPRRSEPLGEYEHKATALIESLDILLRTKQLVVDRADQVLRALRTFEAGKIDFANAARHAGMTLAR